MIIMVKTVEEDIIEIELDPEFNTVCDLKLYIFAMLGGDYLMERQKLLYEGAELLDSQPVGAYNIEPDKFVSVELIEAVGLPQDQNEFNEQHNEQQNEQHNGHQNPPGVTTDPNLKPFPEPKDPSELPEDIGPSSIPSQVDHQAQSAEAAKNAAQADHHTQKVEAANIGAAAAVEAAMRDFSNDDRAAIERLKAMGYDEAMAVQAYVAAEKNESMTAYFLASNADDQQ